MLLMILACKDIRGEYELTFLKLTSGVSRENAPKSEIKISRSQKT
jgi:hypothetical protein